MQPLGCENTNFTNPDGLHDENQYTTANDLLKITLDALKNDTFVKISETKQYEYDGMMYYHTNLMLQPGYLSYYYPYAEGIKTGSTSEAGYCVINPKQARMDIIILQLFSVHRLQIITMMAMMKNVRLLMLPLCLNGHLTA